MNFGKDYELIDTEDVFENDEIVITKPLYTDGINKILCIDVGVKNSDGDVEKFITIDCRLISG